MAQRNRSEVIEYLKRAEVASVGTSDMGIPRQRMMHFGVDDDFNIYVSSMKGDPKVVQWSNIPSTALLVHQGSTFMEMEECEIIGRAEIIRDKEEREKALEIMKTRSPIVANLVKVDAVDRLEFIRIRPFTVKYRFVPEILQGEPPTFFNFPENESKNNIWNDLRSKAYAWKEAVRPLSLTASLIPILLGGVIAYYATGTFNHLLFIFTLLAGLLVQTGTNMINDWKDADSDNDNVEAIRPFTGGSRMIQLGLISRADMGFFGMVNVLLAGIIGVYLVFASGWGLAPIILYGLIAGVFYTGERNRFSLINMAPGLAELLIATTYGVLMTVGAYYIQTEEFSTQALMLSLPVALLITAVLVINQFPDAKADAKANKKTLVVRLGKHKTKNLLFVMFGLSFLIIALLPFLGYAPFTLYFAFIALPFVIQAIRYIQVNHSKTSIDLISGNAHTAIAHLVTGLLIVFAFFYERNSLVYSLAYLVSSLALVFWFWNYIEKKRKDMEKFRQSFKN